jgi:hypothetical protein
MARWNEDQERWRGRGDRYGEEERRFRAERGEEGSWRGREWRDEDRLGEWRGGERRAPSPYELQTRARGEYVSAGLRSRRWTGAGRGEGPPDVPWGRAEEERGGYGRAEWDPERAVGGFRTPGKGPKGWRRSDDRIRDDVAERLARSGVNVDDVEVRVEGGEVTLSGTVERREERRLLEYLAEDVLGVAEVHDRLRLRRGRPREEPGAFLRAGSGTTLTGAAMSAQPAGTRLPSQSQDDPGERR